MREAAALGNIPAVKYYLRATDVNDQNKVNGWTALHWAASRGHKDIVELLLEYGSDCSIKDSIGRRAGELATGSAKGAFPGESQAKDTAVPATENVFVPNYIAAPDLVIVELFS